MVSEKVIYGADKAGCWFDNRRGIYIGEAIIDCAIAHGAAIDPTPESSHERWADDPYYHEIWDEADDFMAQFAAEGFWFGANESGDWGLWASEGE